MLYTANKAKQENKMIIIYLNYYAQGMSNKKSFVGTNVCRDLHKVVPKRLYKNTWMSISHGQLVTYKEPILQCSRCTIYVKKTHLYILHMKDDTHSNHNNYECCNNLSNWSIKTCAV